MIKAITTALSGLNTASQRVNQAAENIAKSGNLDPVDSVDLSEEAINLKIGEIGYKANLAVLRTADELTEELFRVFDKKV